MVKVMQNDKISIQGIHLSAFGDSFWKREGSFKSNTRLYSSELYSCPEGYTKCEHGGYCIPLSGLCDGVVQCTGATDENTCKGTTDIYIISYDFILVFR